MLTWSWHVALYLIADIATGTGCLVALILTTPICACDGTAGPTFSERLTLRVLGRHLVALSSVLLLSGSKVGLNSGWCYQQETSRQWGTRVTK